MSLTQRHKITISGWNYFCQSLGFKTCIDMTDDLFNVFVVITVENQS